MYMYVVCHHLLETVMLLFKDTFTTALHEDVKGLSGEAVEEIATDSQL